MKKTKKLLSSLLACLLAFTCIVSVGTISASAVEEPYCYDVDYLGENISEKIDEFLEQWCDHFFPSNPQATDTIVFVDSQLINYGFLDHICQALSDKFQTTVDFSNIYEKTGIVFLAHYSGGFFYDIQQSTATTLRGYDFSMDEYAAYLEYWIENVNMCGLGVWQLDDTIHQFFSTVRNQRGDNFPIYCVYRDLIELSGDGLMFLYFNSNGDFFDNCYDAPGAIYT